MSSCHFALNHVEMSDVGLVRPNNEDAYGTLKDPAFFVLADGMGGHRAGKIAAEKAIEAIFLSIKKRFIPSKKNWTISDLKILNKRYIQDANRWVHHLGTNKKDYQGMGTTICTLHFYERFLIYSHVGDSRIYRLRNQSLEQLTSDHSLKNAMIDRKQINEEEAKDFVFKNIITRALGTRTSVKPDIKSTKVDPGDLYLMCSDGLTDRVRNEEIRQVLIAKKTIETATKTLIELAKKRGGQDNVTVILVQANERENLFR